MELSSLRTEIRTDDINLHDEYAQPFLNNEFSEENISNFFKYYNSFTEETQQNIKNKLF